MFNARIVFALGLVVLAGASLGFGDKTKAKPNAKVSYASVAPIFKANCLMCHNGPRGKHGLDLTSYATLMKGDKEGKVVIAGKPASSRLSKAIHRKGAAAMPPMGPLPAGDVAKIDAWIKAGAKA